MLDLVCTRISDNYSDSVSQMSYLFSSLILNIFWYVVITGSNIFVTRREWKRVPLHSLHLQNIQVSHISSYLFDPPRYSYCQWYKINFQSHIGWCTVCCLVRSPYCVSKLYAYSLQPSCFHSFLFSNRVWYTLVLEYSSIPQQEERNTERGKNLMWFRSSELIVKSEGLLDSTILIKS